MSNTTKTTEEKITEAMEAMEPKSRKKFEEAKAERVAKIEKQLADAKERVVTLEKKLAEEKARTRKTRTRSDKAEATDTVTKALKDGMTADQIREALEAWKNSQQ